MQYNNCVPWQQLTHQLYHEQTLPLFVKGVAVRITTSLLHNIILVISIVNVQGQRCRLLTTCFVGILDASGTYAEISQVGSRNAACAIHYSSHLLAWGSRV